MPIECFFVQTLLIESTSAIHLLRLFACRASDAAAGRNSAPRLADYQRRQRRCQSHTLYLLTRSDACKLTKSCEPQAINPSGYSLYQ
jgi:hypothetical protein